MEGGGKITLKGLDGSQRADMTLHNVFLEQPSIIQDRGGSMLRFIWEGSNGSEAGNDVTVSGAQSGVASNVCEGGFVPFPVPISAK